MFINCTIYNTFIFILIQIPPTNSKKQQILDGVLPRSGSLSQVVETHVNAGKSGLWVIRVIRSSGFGISRERESERREEKEAKKSVHTS